jgi:hypothetical protein
MITLHAVKTASQGEDFGEDWDGDLDIESAVQAMGGAVRKDGPEVLSGAAQGAAMGASIGGPWGGAIGAGAGAVNAMFSAKRKGGRALQSPGVKSKSQPSPTGVPLPPTGATAPAATQLLQLLSSEPLQQAILSATAPGNTAPVVPVGGAGQPGSEVPVGALLALLGSLAAQAADEAESYSDDDSYLRGADGSYRCDPAVEAERHAALLELITESEETSEPEMDAEAWLVAALPR